MSGRPLDVIEMFDMPWPVRTVHVDAHEIEVSAVVFVVPVEKPIGDGCVNDTTEDRVMWRAEYRGRPAYGDTPEEAARAALIL